jgi:hydrogenase/urease accessory protein HupE
MLLRLSPAFSMLLMADLILGIPGIHVPIVESDNVRFMLARGQLIAFTVRLPGGT